MDFEDYIAPECPVGAKEQTRLAGGYRRVKALTADEEALLANDLQAGLKVEIESVEMWVIGRPVLQTQLRIRIYSEVR